MKLLSRVGRLLRLSRVPLKSRRSCRVRRVVVTATLLAFVSILCLPCQVVVECSTKEQTTNPRKVPALIPCQQASEAIEQTQPPPGTPESPFTADDLLETPLCAGAPGGHARVGGKAGRREKPGAGAGAAVNGDSRAVLAWRYQRGVQAGVKVVVCLCQGSRRLGSGVMLIKNASTYIVHSVRNNAASSTPSPQRQPNPDIQLS